MHTITETEGRFVTYGDTNTARTRPESIFGIMKPIFAMDRPELYVPHAGWFRHEPDDEVARFLSEGWFEYKEQAFLWLYLRPGDTFLDGGAHVGLYSVVARPRPEQLRNDRRRGASSRQRIPPRSQSASQQRDLRHPAPVRALLALRSGDPQRRRTRKVRLQQRLSY